ncbi:serine hydrolase domain-containing protein [Fimbriiglobus ruber]|uniref:Beta-lactamase class C n=1 Tax=Fimbriiglobus ruber TaxID=1908690 RepID=A0A225DKH2_9BACT|nr:serine hydrolase domain-containing protein [Fimbriiglobus ruber]OWK39088.1 Beta-lactamase class C [Fimbriiglobus ruber]
MLIASGRYLAAILCLFVAAPLASADEPKRAAVDELVKSFLKDKPYLGLVVGISRPAGREIFGYGQVTLDGKQHAPDGTTIYEIGSLTKVFTGTLLADQVLRGAVKLDDPVQKHLPDTLTVPRRDDRDITLLHLATHTSSLPVQPPLIGLVAVLKNEPDNPYGHYDRASLGKTLSGLKLDRPIGARFDYSNLGVGLLGHALAHTAGAESYEALLVQRLTKPLGLADTRVQLSAEQNKRFAPGYDRKGEPTAPWTFACLEACGGLRSTAGDLLLFADAAMGRRKTPLSEAFRTAQQPWRETCHGPTGTQSIGLCWFREPFPPIKGEWIWHNGGTGGFRSFLALVPAKNLGVVLLGNSPHPLDKLAVEIVQALAKDD